jgi:hypothetical protein
LSQGCCEAPKEDNRGVYLWALSPGRDLLHCRSTFDFKMRRCAMKYPLKFGLHPSGGRRILS